MCSAAVDDSGNNDGCSWNNNGCSGGDTCAALQWMIQVIMAGVRGIITGVQGATHVQRCSG